MKLQPVRAERRVAEAGGCWQAGPTSTRTRTMNIQQPGGHLDQMLRQTRQHHVQLSSMADLKANLLITMSSLVMTLSAHLLEQHRLQIPVLILMVGCGVTILLGAYSVMPKLPLRRGDGPPPDPASPALNLLFFGDFTRLSYEEYAAEMEKVLNDPSRTYETMLREVYALGVFLARRKYRWLRLAYCAFMTGVAASIVTGLLTLLPGLS